MILIKLLCNFIKIALQHGCSPVNLLQTFRTPLRKNTSEGLLLVSCFGVLFRDVTRVSSYEFNPIPHNPVYYYSCLEASFANILKKIKFHLSCKIPNDKFQFSKAYGKIYDGPFKLQNIFLCFKVPFRKQISSFSLQKSHAHGNNEKTLSKKTYEIT